MELQMKVMKTETVQKNYLRVRGRHSECAWNQEQSWSQRSLHPGQNRLRDVME